MVSIVRISHYDQDLVMRAMRDCLEPLGGMRAFVSPGQKVLLKPNVLGAFGPDKAVTTHPTVLAAALTLVRECGGIPSVGDSPGIGEMAQAFKSCGLSQVIEAQGASFADFSNEYSIDTPDNTIGRHLTVAKAVADADVILSLPKLKTHVQMTFTGAIKNQFGLVVGMQKGQYHFRLKTREKLAELLVDINRATKPVLAIFDAITAMEGAGPSGGEPRQVGLMLASADLMALDVIACEIIGLAPLSVPTIAEGARRLFGQTDPAAIDIAGPAIADVRVSDFKIPDHFKSVLGILPLPQFMLKWFGGQWSSRPRIDAERCIACYRCRDGCPVSPPAIDPDRPPGRQVDDRSCIRCYCCHEFCPVKAIDLERSLLDRVVNLTGLLSWCSRKMGRILSKFSI